MSWLTRLFGLSEPPRLDPPPTWHSETTTSPPPQHPFDRLTPPPELYHGLTEADRRRLVEEISAILHTEIPPLLKELVVKPRRKRGDDVGQLINGPSIRKGTVGDPF